jgi:hypothetical protein
MEGTESIQQNNHNPLLQINLSPKKDFRQPRNINRFAVDLPRICPYIIDRTFRESGGYGNGLRSVPAGVTWSEKEWLISGDIKGPESRSPENEAVASVI